jgi:hypothetical protein
MLVLILVRFLTLILLVMWLLNCLYWSLKPTEFSSRNGSLRVSLSSIIILTCVLLLTVLGLGTTQFR